MPDELAGGKLILDEPALGVARLSINNLEKRNALDHAILDAIARTVPTLDHRCLVITGRERVFSAGYDIGNIPDDVFAQEAEKLVAHPFTEAIEAIEAYRFPTVAALNGHTIGGGLEVALSCDLRIAVDGIKLGMPPAKLGLVYSHTGLQKFIDAIGLPRTRELFLVGRNIDANAALTWGLVNDIAPEEQFEERWLGWAAEIAENAPLSLAGNKLVIQALLDARAGLDPKTEAELVEIRRACFVSEDFREGVRAFAEKRAPRWQGR